MLNITRKTILANGVTTSNDTYATKLNNNQLVIGPSGCGKTTLLIPNIMQQFSSYVVGDSKGNLCKKLSPLLKREGYEVMELNFIETNRSIKYNPLKYIRRNQNGRYSEEDIMKLAHIILDDGVEDDPFWIISGRDVIACLIAFVLETYPEEEKTLSDVNGLSKKLGVLKKDENGKLVGCQSMLDFMKAMAEYGKMNPESFACRKYMSFANVISADRTWGCILQFVHAGLSCFDSSEMANIFSSGDRRIDFDSFGRKPTAVFVCVSDTDRSMDKMANLFYSQMFQELTALADKMPGQRLEIPCHIYLDDFASGCRIPDFDKVISVIRSRNISVSLIVQCLAQLQGMYGNEGARTITNNCDTIVYFGGYDYETCQFISRYVNKSIETVMTMPLDKVYVVRRGIVGFLADRILPESYTVPVYDEEPADENQQASSASEVKEPEAAEAAVALAAVPDDTDKDEPERCSFAVPSSLIKRKPSGTWFTFVTSIVNDHAVFGSAKLPDNAVTDCDDRQVLIDLPDNNTGILTIIGDRRMRYTAAEIRNMFETNSPRYKLMRRRNATASR